jgi:hypothetical protein
MELVKRFIERVLQEVPLSAEKVIRELREELATLAE